MRLDYAQIRETYNSLLDLEVADSFVRERDTDLVDPLLAVVTKHALHDRVGIRLLHRHNDILDSEIMAESHVIDDLGLALITRATHGEYLADSYVPNSWALRHNRFIPIEFSASNLVADPDVNPEMFPAFFAELAAEISRLGAGDVLGPSLLGSDFIEQHRPPGATVMMEYSALDDRANVLRFLVATPNNAEGTAIDTHWRLAGPTDQLGQTVKKCTKICPPIGNPPKHQGTYVHKQS